VCVPAQGRVVSFKNTIIIMTSNLGSDMILEADGNREMMRNYVMAAVSLYVWKGGEAQQWGDVWVGAVCVCVSLSVHFVWVCICLCLC